MNTSTPAIPITPKPPISKVGAANIQYFMSSWPHILLMVVILCYAIMGFISMVVTPNADELDSNVSYTKEKDIAEIIFNSIAISLTLFVLGYWWNSTFSKIFNSGSGIFMNLFFLTIFFQFVGFLLNILTVAGVGNNDSTNTTYFFLRSLTIFFIIFAVIIYVTALIPGMVDDHNMGL